MKFRVPHENERPTLVELLRRASPESSSGERHRAIGSGGVRVDDRAVRNPKRKIEPDAVVTITADLGADRDFGVPDARELARGDGFVIVDRPLGFPGTRAFDDPVDPVAFLADVLGFDRETFRPLWDVPTNAAGPWICVASDGDADLLYQRLVEEDLTTWWTAIVPEFGLPTGELEADGIRLSYATVRKEGGLAEIQLKPVFRDVAHAMRGFAAICEALAQQGAPPLADPVRGGYMVDGGLRLRLMSMVDTAGAISAGWNAPPAWWPDVPVVPRIEPATPQQKAQGVRRLRVSDKTLEILDSGHPWALADAQSDDADAFGAGTIVQLESARGKLGPYALVDGAGDVLARVWSRDSEAVSDFGGEVQLRVDEAFARRAELFASLDSTDLFRVIHGEADGIPGLFVDRIGPLYRATMTGFAAARLREVVYDLIADMDPHAMLVEVMHTRDVRSGGGGLPAAEVALEGSRYLRPGERVVGREDGLRFWCEPWEGIDVGFFADQRHNRRIAVERAAPGSRWLNLFCHTGAFTVALVRAGAEVVSVDLSRRYLDWLDENLALNDLSASQNLGVATDARLFLDQDDATYDGIIVDPPTASSGDAGFWSVQRDVESLLQSCFARLNPGGCMLVCRNARRRKTSLSEQIQRAAHTAGAEISALTPAPIAPDFPTLPSFPEGDSFEGIWVTRAQ